MSKKKRQREKEDREELHELRKKMKNLENLVRDSFNSLTAKLQPPSLAVPAAKSSTNPDNVVPDSKVKEIGGFCISLIWRCAHTSGETNRTFTIIRTYTSGKA